MLDVVPVLRACEILTTKVFENHRDGNAIVARQYHFAALSDFFYHTDLFLIELSFPCIR